MKKAIRILALILILSVTTALFSACSQSGATSKITGKFDTSTEPRTLKQLCAQCSTIVRGKIAKYNKAIDIKGMNDSLAGVRTYFSIDVSVFIKGDEKNKSTVEASFLGGETKKQICTPISGALPQIGEEHIFFINEDGSYYPAFRIQDDQIILEQFLDSKLFTDKSKSQQTVSADALVAEIKDIVAAQAQTANQ